MAAVVGRQDAVAGVGEGDEDVAELVGCFWEAVDEEDGPFGLWALGRRWGGIRCRRCGVRGRSVGARLGCRVVWGWWRMACLFD